MCQLLIFDHKSNIQGQKPGPAELDLRVSRKMWNPDRDSCIHTHPGCKLKEPPVFRGMKGNTKIRSR